MNLHHFKPCYFKRLHGKYCVSGETFTHNEHRLKILRV